ncbi:Hypothetical protein SRAE_2000084400 [Strongyloides ratti]|uniref:Uncharacterized protein n=1 Tax=Strongyloides ratti TaxID=34506 RepID=A0A090MXX1_STRRB|nr:Hypothetical protein SRAE_2000084400 [Strongyloides ratti]CEF66174.1 Hypothetical protein SRAE_2000084400 [Strongyloides ratti]
MHFIIIKYLFCILLLNSFIVSIPRNVKGTIIMYEILPDIKIQKDTVLYDGRFDGPYIKKNDENILLKEWIKRYHYNYMKRAGGRGFSINDDNGSVKEIIPEKYVTNLGENINTDNIYKLTLYDEKSNDKIDSDYIKINENKTYIL